MRAQRMKIILRVMKNPVLASLYVHKRYNAPHSHTTCSKLIRENYLRTLSRINFSNKTAVGQYELGAVHTPTEIQELSENSEYWIGDTSTTTHLTNSSEGMINIKYPTDTTQVVIGNGTRVNREQVGGLITTVHNKAGNPLYNAILENVVVSKEAKFNLFSITAMLKKGWSLSGSATHLILTKDMHKLDFDIIIHTPKGILFVVQLARQKGMDLIADTNDVPKANANRVIQDSIEVNTNPVIEVGKSSNIETVKKKSEGPRTVNISTGHGMMSHMGEDAARKSLTYLGYPIMRGKLKPCEAC